MASSILNSDDGVISGTSGLKSSGGDDGVLVFQSKGTETARINTDKQIVAAAGTASLPALTTTGDVNTGIFFPAADTIAFAEGGAEAMRINSSGNVGIGTTSPQATLDVRNIHSSFGARSVENSNAYITSGWDGSNYFATRLRSDFFGNFSIATGTVPIANAPSAGSLTERMRIDSEGGLILAGSTAQKATGTTWSNPSDQRLKDNIRDYTKGITELMQVRVREWEYNGKGGTVDGTKGLGVVADEIVDVLPDTVKTYEAKLNADDEETTAIKKFDATEITWLLVNAVKELSAKNDALEARIAALEAVPGNE